MKILRILPVVVFVLAIVLPGQVDAQCAMCSATNETAMQEGEGLGINQGIIYLMGIPYVLLGFLGFLFFRKRISGFVREMKEIHD